MTLRPQTLRAFMALSAASARERAISMRRCAYCDDWFELRRSDAVYCSAIVVRRRHHKRRATLQQQTRLPGDESTMARSPPSRTRTARRPGASTGASARARTAGRKPKTFRTYKAAREHRNAMDARSSAVSAAPEGLGVRLSRSMDRRPRSPTRRTRSRRRRPRATCATSRIAKRGLKQDRLLSQLDKHHLDRAYDELLENGKLLPDGATGPLTKQTVLHVHRLLHKALNDAVDNKLITDNPASRAEAPRVQGKHYKTKVRPFTKDETLLLFARAQDPICDPDTYPMAATLAVTGLRRGELAGLADDAVDWDRGVISMFRNVVEVDGEVVVKETKTEAGRRTLRIPAELVALLREQRTRVLKTALVWGAEYRRKPLYLFPGLGGAADASQADHAPDGAPDRAGRHRARRGQEDQPGP